MILSQPVKNSKKEKNKMSKKAVETSTKAVETKKAATEKKVEKVKFDKKAFYTEFRKAFAKDTLVDVVADTDLENSINKDEYEYIHFFKKGTTKNLFQMYVKAGDVKFVVGMALQDFLKQGKNYTITPVEKKRGEDGEKKPVYLRVSCSHEDAVAVAQTILQAQTEKLSVVVEVPEKKVASSKKTTTQKKSAKKDA